MNCTKVHSIIMAGKYTPERRYKSRVESFGR